VGAIGMFNPDIDLPPTQRIDAGVAAGDIVSIHYDPMIGKLIAFGESREEAIEELIDLIDKTPVSGLVTNRDFLRNTLMHPDFIAGKVHTGFIAEHEKNLLTPYKIDKKDYSNAAFSILAARHSRVTSNDPWDLADNFRVNLQTTETLLFDSEEGLVTVELFGNVNAASATVEGEEFGAENIALEAGQLSYLRDGLKHTLFAEVSEEIVSLVSGEATMFISRHARDGGADDDADGPGTIVAPMPGKILEIKVEEGEAVTKGQPLLVMEAMKMEQTISAPKDGTVTGLSIAAGDQVSDHAVLLSVIEPQE
ncbi:MAG: biotin/lipoyl-containing protein, partial [Kordiimonas sp.]